MGKASREKRERRANTAPVTRTLYHFTSSFHLPQILRSEVLRPTDSLVDGVKGLWFLDTPTADHTHGLDYSSVDKREVRITVRTADAVHWLTWVKDQPIDPGLRDTYIKVGGGLEAAKHWWMTLGPVGIDQWTDIDWRIADGRYSKLPDPSPANPYGLPISLGRSRRLPPPEQGRT